jgi:hypothetical protein
MLELSDYIGGMGTDDRAREAVRVFLLSPAHCGGIRASYLLHEGAKSPLAERLRDGGASIGEVFTFMSGLYFRGKLAYAAAFARAPRGGGGVHVIVPGQGLLAPDTTVDLGRLEAIAKVEVDLANRGYTGPLHRDVALVAEQLGPDGDAVLLGSIATPKYIEPLGAVLGARLRVPRQFVGRGDMSRGSLMLRAAAAGTELEYVGTNEVSPAGG